MCTWSTIGTQFKYHATWNSISEPKGQRKKMTTTRKLTTEGAMEESGNFKTQNPLDLMEFGSRLDDSNQQIEKMDCVTRTQQLIRNRQEFLIKCEAAAAVFLVNKKTLS